MDLGIQGILAERCYPRKQHIDKEFIYRAPMRKTSARQVLARNLQRLMDASELLHVQEQVGSRAGVGQTTVGLMLNPHSDAIKAPKLDTIERVAEAFGLEAWQLLLNEESLSPGDFELLMQPRRAKSTAPTAPSPIKSVNKVTKTARKVEK